MTPLAQNTLCICGKADCSIPYGACHCGCGGKTKISYCTASKPGWVKGEPRLFIRFHRRRKSLEARFWDSVVKSPGCWLWKGYVWNGYGRLAEGGKDGPPVSAHRLSYQINVGPIPAGMDIHHLCGVKLCVNPEHLHPCDIADHRRLDNERNGGNGNALKQLCKQGHPYNNENTAISKNGSRRCKKCCALTVKNWRKRNPEKSKAQWRRAESRKRAKSGISNPITAYRSGEPLSCDPPQEPERP